MASKKSFFSLLAGLAAGAAIGILYAPDKGWKTRARVKKAAENGYDDIKENLGDLGAKESTRDLLLKQLERLENALKQAEEEAEEAFTENPEPDEQAPEA